MIQRSQWDAEGVPEHLRQAVQVLNEALAIDTPAVTKLLDVDVPLSAEAAKRVLDHPTIIIGGTVEVPTLSGLGLLNGALSTEKFRICVTLDKEGAPYDKFDVCRVVEEDPPS